MPLGRWKVESFGQELVIRDLRYEDAGVYECQGINEVWNTPTRRSITLNIECKFRLVCSLVQLLLAHLKWTETDGKHWAFGFHFGLTCNLILLLHT